MKTKSKKPEFSLNRVDKDSPTIIGDLGISDERKNILDPVIKGTRKTTETSMVDDIDYVMSHCENLNEVAYSCWALGQLLGRASAVRELSQNPNLMTATLMAGLFAGR